MSKQNVTLKQIAQEAGVSITTVHRVLNDKDGYSSEVRDKILRIAKKQGYTVNYAAASLRQKTLYIALVFPNRDPLGKYYMQRLLNGYLAYREEVSKLNAVFQEYYYQPDSTSKLKILENIYRERPVPFDGVVVYGLSPTKELIALLNRFEGRRIPVVMLERVPEELVCSCCVMPDDEMAGAMAGELLSKMTSKSGTVLIFNQKTFGPDTNGLMCAETIRKARPDLKPIQLEIPIEGTLQTELIKEHLRCYADTTAVYATSARHTAALVKAMQQNDCRIDVAIGSDLFEESDMALGHGWLDVVIDKNPYDVGYHALRLLLAYVIRKEKLPERYKIIPRIVLRANRSAYRDP